MEIAKELTKSIKTKKKNTFEMERWIILESENQAKDLNIFIKFLILHAGDYYVAVMNGWDSHYIIRKT